jgi:hypothetical protein
MTTTIPAIEQALSGARLAHDTPIRCADCGSRLSEGSPVTVAAVRESDRWRITAVYGAACAPIATGDLAIENGPVALVEGDIGCAVDTAAQSHHPILLDAVVIDTAEEVA